MERGREQRERIAVVTGANRGIGLAVARSLAGRRFHVVLACRDGASGAAARDAILAGGGSASLVVGDLGSLAATRALAAALQEACPRIDLLVQNAGLWPSRRELNEDGFERAFAVNHLGPFLLARLLEPRLCDAGSPSPSPARVVMVSAGLYVKGAPDLERTPTGDDFHAIKTYATTKCASLMMMPLLAERWAPHGVTVDAVHPGVIRTDLGARPGALGLLLRLVKRLWKTPEEGARPVVRLALEERGSGRYFHLDEEMALAPVAADAALARALWQHAERVSGLGGRERSTHDEAQAAAR